MSKLVNTILRLYSNGESIKSISKQICVGEQKVRRVLVTEGIYTSDYTAQINKMYYEYHQSIDSIAQHFGVTSVAIQSHLPYIKTMYKSETPSQNALRIRAHRAHRERKEKL